ncbi:MAG TPA: acetolactate synthase small subunit [Candidatus Altiarchaeales archaeon]|nr:MAG: acetolactate synthase small subunit [Candidatus Altiarchaeales archaeon ex4484_43]HDH41235.1 acetolactate synthase small subunit [Candidatus Altiarchaeales archaeon]
MRAHIFTALVEHKPGVLQRLASMFARRRFNIESITVGPTENPKIARMTILTVGDDKILEQIEKQMNKLINVIKVSDLSVDECIRRELCIVKINAPKESQKAQIMQYTDVFRGRVVDVSPDTISIEITGDSEKIDAFIDLVRGMGIKIVARTGITAMPRG